MGGMTIVRFAASPVAWRAVTRAPDTHVWSRAPDTHVQLPYPPESERQPCSSSGEPVLSLEKLSQLLFLLNASVISSLVMSEFVVTLG